MKKKVMTRYFAMAALSAGIGIPATKAQDVEIEVPDGFEVTVFAKDLGRIRGLAVSPEGNVYGRVRDKGLVAMSDRNGDGKADQIRELPLEIGDGSGIGYHEGFLYFSSNNALYRLPLSGQLLPRGAPELIVDDLGDRRSHASKMFTFDESGNVYVEVGSPQNALSTGDRGPGAEGLSDEEVEKFLSEFGGIWRFDADKPGQTKADGHHMTTGQRHILSLAWNPVSGELFGAQNGRDVLNVVDSTNFTPEYNAERVAEEFHLLREGSNLGWPYTYYDPIDNVRLLSPEYGGDGQKQPESGRFQDPIIAFPAHWAPMQMTYYGASSFPEKYRGGLFLAFHGSWNRYPVQQGYRVVFIPFNEDGMPTGEWETFANGFMGAESIPDSGRAKHRPMGVAVGPDGSLYIGDDQGGYVWKVSYKG